MLIVGSSGYLLKYSSRLELVNAIRTLYMGHKYLSEKISDIVVQEYDLLSEPKEKYDIIRIMNVLHHSYFNKSEIKSIVNNLQRGLNENALLIIGLNEGAGSNVNAEIFQKKNNQLHSFTKIGNGSCFGKIPQNFIDN